MKKYNILMKKKIILLVSILLFHKFSRKNDIDKNKRITRKLEYTEEEKFFRRHGMFTE